MSDPNTEARKAWATVARRIGALTVTPPDDVLGHIARRAHGRLDYNESRSGYAAPATELARYNLVLLAALEQAGRAAEVPGVCSECGVPPGEPHREACFFLTGDPADLLENRAGD